VPGKARRQHGRSGGNVLCERLIWFAEWKSGLPGSPSRPRQSGIARNADTETWSSFLPYPANSSWAIVRLVAVFLARETAYTRSLAAVNKCYRVFGNPRKYNRLYLIFSNPSSTDRRLFCRNRAPNAKAGCMRNQALRIPGLMVMRLRSHCTHFPPVISGNLQRTKRVSLLPCRHCGCGQAQSNPAQFHSFGCSAACACARQTVVVLSTGGVQGLMDQRM
jgi:hypothetical protein